MPLVRPSVGLPISILCLALTQAPGQIGVQRVGSAPDRKVIGAALSTLLASSPQVLAAGRASGREPAARVRVLGVSPAAVGGAVVANVPVQWWVTAYDYSAERAYRALVNGDGVVQRLVTLTRQPPPDRLELAAAIESLRNSTTYGPLIRNGRLHPYPAMPPVDERPGVPRTLFIGLRPSGADATHEIVGVRLGDGSVISHADAAGSRAPATALASAELCGLPASDCSAENAGVDAIRIKWPSESNPIWDFTVVRPSATQTEETPDGAGVELRDVHYRGTLVLLSANVPVLNVKYDDDRCGPYRDWLHTESCFTTNGSTEIQPGFHFSMNEAQTICATGSDAGTGRGVAVQQQADFVTVASEMQAGWYRYLNGWRLHLNGDIDAIFQYAGTVNSCMCNRRTHHAYWRLDWAIGGRRHASPPNDWLVSNTAEITSASQPAWTPMTSETTFLRTADGGLRIRDVEGGVSYLLQPGGLDGTALNDPYAQSDVWVLRWKATETSDLRRGGTEIDIGPYLDNESVQNTRVTTWYAAHLRQEGAAPGSSNVCASVGPRLVRIQP